MPEQEPLDGNTAKPGVGAFPDAFIELHQVVKIFKNAAGEFRVLKGIDAAMYEGQFVSIVGRSGSGKSTLLNMMTGIDHPTSGTVRIGDTILQTMNEGQMSVWRGKKMGIVFQFFQLLPMLTLLENVMLPMDFCDMYPQAERESRAMDLLKMVGLDGFEYQYPAAVSGGQQQSAAVARALANDPPILVADEPTGNLDTKTAERVLEIFEEQVALGKTVMMVTHDNTLAQRAKRILIISDGELVNEHLSTAFPALDHHLLLDLTHSAKAQTFQPGQPLAGGASAPALALPVRGWFRVGASGRRFAAGEPISAADLRAGKFTWADLHAGEAAEVLLFDQAPETGELRDLLNDIAQSRMGRNG
jgi:putative ABC transport system ATP-binding protein